MCICYLHHVVPCDRLQTTKERSGFSARILDFHLFDSLRVGSPSSDTLPPHSTVVFLSASSFLRRVASPFLPSLYQRKSCHRKHSISRRDSEHESSSEAEPCARQVRQSGDNQQSI